LWRGIPLIAWRGLLLIVWRDIPHLVKDMYFIVWRDISFVEGHTSYLVEGLAFIVSDQYPGNLLINKLTFIMSQI
jgi:hypothetical protein